MSETTVPPFSAGSHHERNGNLTAEHMDPDYNLSPDEQKQLENILVEQVFSIHPAEEICAAWINPYNPLSNVVRTYEASVFPEAADFPPAAESSILLLALVNTRPEVRRIIHGATVMGPGLNPKDKIAEADSTGFYTIDSLIRLGNFSRSEFYNYYAEKGIDVSKWITVESNYRIGDKVELSSGIRAAAFAYLAMFRLVSSRAAPNPEAGGVIASINTGTRKSFTAVGIEFEPLMGRTDLITEEEDPDYQPAAIPTSPHNAAVFEQMGTVLPTTLF
jgi:hypothetical protein